MSTCTEAGCGGTIAADGYCDTCGMAAAPAAAAPTGAPVAAAPPPGAAAAAPPPGASVAAASGVCTQPGCGGTIAADGYCDTCGMAGAVAAGAPAASPSMRDLAEPLAPPPGSAATPSIAAPTAPGTSRRVGGSSRRTSRSSRTGTSRSGLGLGLVTVAPTDVGDPSGAIMSAEKIAAALGEVPEDNRFCSSCGQAVGRTVDGRPGRLTGFCSNCRTPFDFVTNAPSLAAGELVGGQYEILGPLAHGGMGWIYLGRDRAVSDRWVVLKGLLNQDDPDAAASAVAERQFLAQLDHPSIVQIYNFVTHLGRGYIVMEYVGGDSLNGKLKDRRRANGGVPDPLPAADAIAYILGVMPAFAYLHQNGLVYNDLKPANVMAVGDSVKLIDVGGVMRIDDEDAAIFGTAGFQAPEVAADGPSVASDLFTVGRTLAVLILDFVFHAGAYEHTLPPPREAGVLAQWESLHRFLLKATAFHPDDRFHNADEMAEQLTGVLREIVAITEAEPRPAPSKLFGGDRLTSLLIADPTLTAASPDWRSLPVPSIDPADPAAALLAELEELEPGVVLGLMAGVTDPATLASRELRLRRARALLATGMDPTPLLAELEAEDPWDWRVEWYRSLHHLARGEAAVAAEGFGRVWTEVPGELAPRLGAALAAELAGEHGRAAVLYERVVGIDTTYVTAAFGLARCHAAVGDRAAAVSAYGRVPQSSATWEDAQVAAARALVSGDRPLPGELVDAAATVERLKLDATERATLSAEILERALEGVRSGTLAPAPDATVFGHRLDEAGLQAALEDNYRELARLARDPADKVAWVDRANAIRPRTIV
jgi:serine/threonine-protein kinase PknG